MLFHRSKKDDIRLDKALAQPTPPEPIPEKLYVAFIELDTEVLRCYGLSASNLQRWLIHWGTQGCYLTRGKEPSVYVPPHRILKVTFRPEEEVEREDREGKHP